MYKGHCFTNLDSLKAVAWPTEFAFPPRVGDRVESKDGERILKVVGVTHTTIRRKGDGGLGPYDYTEASFKVELNH